MANIQKITPFLWFSDEAETAANYYVSIFKDSKVLHISRYTEAGKEQHQRQPGSVMLVDFELEGQPFTALNGGSLFKFNESISFVVHCASQQEVDYYWEKLTAGGDPRSQQCGWLKDKFGVSWQVVPDRLLELLKDPSRAEKVMAALMKMKKLDLAAIERASAS